MRDFLKKILFRVLSPLYKKYTSVPRPFQYKDTRITVLDGVFFPKWIWSTSLLLNYLEQKDLKGKKILELGAGNGIISFRSADRGAIVTASDISKRAIEGLKINNGKRDNKITILDSDLFDNFPSITFDKIIINPPYYPKQPQNEQEMAWFCGSEFEYFEKLFSQLKAYTTKGTETIMILSEDCNLKVIEKMGLKHQWKFEQIKEIKKWSETNYLFQLTSLSE